MMDTSFLPLSTGLLMALVLCASGDHLRASGSKNGDMNKNTKDTRVWQNVFALMIARPVRVDADVLASLWLGDFFPVYSISASCFFLVFHVAVYRSSQRATSATQAFRDLHN